VSYSLSIFSKIIKIDFLEFLGYNHLIFDENNIDIKFEVRKILFGGVEHDNCN